MPSGNELPRFQIPERADRLCQILATRPTTQAIDEAANLLGNLRDLREFARLCDLAELVCRFRLDDATARRLYAQGLIETGRLIAAIDFLKGAKHHFGAEHFEYAEFEGLLGRAYKQLFVDTVDPDGTLGTTFIERAAAAYQGPYARDCKQFFWHGVNLGALAHAAQCRNMPVTAKLARDYVTELLAHLELVAPTARDQWWFATKAEAHAARAEWIEAEDALRRYVENPATTAFMLASTLRQLRDIWSIQSDLMGARLLQMLEAMLMRWPEPGGAVLKMGARHLVQMRTLQPNDDQHMQRIAGPSGFETLKWYRTGLGCAASVAAVTERLGLRFGTGFAVRAEDFGVEPKGEVLVLTNFHVLNSAGLGGQSDFRNVELVFEAVDDGPLTFTVRAVVAESDANTGLDYALLRLAGHTEQLIPLPLSHGIPAAASKARIYVIGYPLGDVMQFSLQDNVLIDHECEPAGRPPNPARRRVQYSASTEKGNSGSPVFDDKWDCIALHHAGGKRNSREERYGIPALNGGITFVEANQGIWIGSIQEDVRTRKLRLP